MYKGVQKIVYLLQAIHSPGVLDLSMYKNHYMMNIHGKVESKLNMP